MNPFGGTLPDPLPSLVEASLRSMVGSHIVITGVRGAGGGSIHQAMRLDTTDGPYFLKWNTGGAGRGFEAEARGVEALRKGAAREGLIRVPRVVDARDASGPELADAGWLVLEYLPPHPAPGGYPGRLGRGLAALHLAGRQVLDSREPLRMAAGAGDGRRVRGTPDPGSRARFGWSEDNWIGPLPQRNSWTDDWSSFWRDERLTPQLEGALETGDLTGADSTWIQPLLDAVEPVLREAGPDTPHLLHGDLWSGNAHPGPDGSPVLVDPSVYLGHGEVDLAMADLFGGFPEETFEAYAEVIPLDRGFHQVRKSLYQLYYLLVHLRLFGPSYLERTRDAARVVILAAD
jgi:protein-ribulosamine 3-kinase